LSRSVGLYANGQEVAGIDGLLGALDRFLYDGEAGDSLVTMLTAMKYSILPALFLLVIPAGSTICAAILGCRKDLKKTLGRVALYVSVILFSVFILYPFFVMFITAFRSNAETTDMYFLHILPEKWIFSNLQDTLNRGVLRYLINSLLIAGGATGIAMLCGIPAAYAMARMDFRGKKAYLGFVIMSQMFSPVVLLVGISRLMNTLNLNDTLTGLMFINAAFNQAFAIWLLRGTFVSISPEMEQAACIDGCNVVSAMIRILLPMAAPGIVTTLIFVFINAWNEYTVSTVLISTTTNRPITVGITQFSSFNMIEWQYLFAAALLATVPVVILFMLIEKHLAAGLTAGGVKG
ncbi:MAG: carbohydrate ABC transporter permease, partial [Clostridia bacterium]